MDKLPAIDSPGEQKWPETLVIVRHGESARNVAKDVAKKKRDAIYWAPDLGRDQDTPLTEKGLLQAKYTANYIRNSVLETADSLVIFVSPFLRTVQTADPLIKLCDPPPKVIMEERVREVEFGILDGLTAKGIREKYPEEWKRKQLEGKYWYRAPGGESRPDVRDRVRSFLNTLARDYAGEDVVVYCHSVIVLVFRSLLERWDERQYLAVDKESDVANCSVTTYRWEALKNKLVLDGFNICDHMTSL